MKVFDCHFKGNSGSCRLSVPTDAYDHRNNLCGLHSLTRQVQQLDQVRNEHRRRAQEALTFICSVDRNDGIELIEAKVVSGLKLPERIQTALTIAHSSIEDVAFFQDCRSAVSLRFAACSLNGGFELRDTQILRGLQFDSSVCESISLVGCSVGEGIVIVPGTRFTLKLENCVVSADVRAAKSGKGDSFELIATKIRSHLDLRKSEIDMLTIKDCEISDVNLASVLVRGHLKIDGLNCGAVWLQNSSISNSAHFRHLRVDLTANFQSADFKSSLSVEESRFGGSTTFEGDEMSLGHVNFGSTIFGGTLTFRNRKFTGQIDFSRCTFEKAPIFHGCEFHQAMLFPRREAFRDTSGLAAAAAYRTLKLAMEQLRARREEGMFFALEQRSVRSEPRLLGRTDRLVSKLYEVLTDYGQSYLRPAFWMFALLVGFATVYAALASSFGSGSSIDLSLFVRGLVFSFEQLVSPFGVWRKEQLAFPRTDDSVRVLASVESLFGLVLLALLLLALRWRFKRD